MRRSKFDLLIKQQTSAAKQVMDVTPKQEPWTVAQICGELSRLGKNNDHRIVLGCLNTLKNLGLVIESRGSKWIQVHITDKRHAEDEVDELIEKINEEEVVMTKEPTGPIETLTALALKATQIANQLKVLSSEIENAALALETQFETASADSQRLKQLQALLKGAT